MAKHELSKEITKQMKAAIKEFGEYSYMDKGPSEVMDLTDLCLKFKNLSQKEKVQVAKDFKKSYKETPILIEIISSDSLLSSSEINEIALAGGEDLQEHFIDPAVNGGSTYGLVNIIDVVNKNK